MNLQVRVKLKSNELILREIALKTCLETNLVSNSRKAHLLVFVLSPFVVGLAAERLSRTFIGAQFLRAIFPLGSLLSKV